MTIHNDITSRIWKTDYTGATKLLLLALTTHFYDEDGFSWASYDKLADVIGVSQKSGMVKKIINRLIKDGVLMRWSRKSPDGGRGYTNVLLVTLGYSREEVLEIIARRFDVSPKLALVIYSQDHHERILIDTLIRTRGQEKGVMEYPDTEQKGVTEYPVIEDKGVLGYPLEAKKGVTQYPLNNKDSLNTNITTNVVSDKPPPPLKEKPKKRRAPPKTKTEPRPAGVDVYRNIANRFPDKATWPLIAEQVGENKDDLSFWGQVIQDYIACGWNKINIKGMLDFFNRRELPTVKGKFNETHRNGSNPGQGKSRKPIKTYNRKTGQTIWLDPITREPVPAPSG